jgi:hypothetical protein
VENGRRRWSALLEKPKEAVRFGQTETFCQWTLGSKVGFEVSKLSVKLKASGGITAINKGWRKGKL